MPVLQRGFITEEVHVVKIHDNMSLYFIEHNRKSSYAVPVVIISIKFNKYSPWLQTTIGTETSIAK